MPSDQHPSTKRWRRASQIVLGILSGAAFTSLSIYLVGNADIPIFTPLLGQLTAHTYEGVAWIGGALGAFILACSQDADSGILFALGYGVGMPGAVMLLRRSENGPETWLLGFLSVFTTSFVLVEVRKHLLGRKDVKP